ncbi:MAG TPA: RNA polymerase sigma factor [Streptosporangiaceae bacterium]|nr:RNA polymerase sigma factor [Streptosporangiaceae bacterium]
MNAQPPQQAHAAIETVIRLESARLIAGLARYAGGDIGLAEELAQDAVVAALEQWPRDGVPQNPGAWLMTVAKRRAIDQFRRNAELDRKYAQIGRDLAAAEDDGTADLDRAISDGIDDDMLRLIFTACHPVLSVPARVALTLRLVGGLTTAEIARAYLVPEPTIAQRIVRAKKTLASARVPFETPDGQERPARLASVLEVIYLIFNEGYSATAGEDWTRPALCYEALRLGRVLAQLAPDEPEVHGLAALMEIQSSRLAARTGPSGEPVLLLDQDRTRWDQLLIRRGLAALARAEALGGEGALGGERVGRPGPYALQAAIAACHARAFRPDETDWARITELYAVLAEVMPSPIVELNRAVAVSMALGPQAGLDLVDQVAAEPALREYHLLPSVRGDLLAKLGRHAEAQAEFRRASELTANARERELTAQRARTAAWAASGETVEQADQAKLQTEHRIYVLLKA